MSNLGGYAEAIKWAIETLGQTALNTTVLAETPWSTVLKINTQQAHVYLKQTSPELFIEVEVIQKCRDLCNITDIPETIAVNRILHCFLMKSCGDASLRTIFDGHLNVELLIQGLQVYKRMQQATASHLDCFLQIGVPDWRLEHFPSLYLDLISDEDFLRTHGLVDAQINLLQDEMGQIQTLCQALSKYNIPECLNHSDFHDNNMLFSNAIKKVSIIDLGETAINHPFFSLAALLKASSDRYSIMPDSIEYQKLHDACFNGWLDDKKSITIVVKLINILLPVYLIFAQKRFLDAIHLPYNVDNPVSVKQHNKIYAGFMGVINNIKAFDGEQ